MPQDNTAKFTTYGPNRGLTLAIGAYQFVNGSCVVPAQDANAAASILCRYYDVCYAHELEQEIAEYDAAFPNPQAKQPAPLSDSSDIKLPPEGSEIVLVPQANQPAPETAAPEVPVAGTPVLETASTDVPKMETPPADEPATTEAPQADTASKPNNGKKPSNK